jgi:hypothetical protein
MLEPGDSEAADRAVISRHPTHDSMRWQNTLTDKTHATYSLAGRHGHLACFMT